MLPDACADIVITGDGQAFVAGPAHHVSLPCLAPGIVHGVRFRTAAIGRVFGLPATELADAFVPLDAVVGTGRAQAALDTLLSGCDQSAWWTDTPNPPNRHDQPNRPHRPDRLVWPDGDQRWLGAACAALLAGRGSVSEVADAVGLSSRQLRRRLLDAAGQGPKTLQRVGRLQRFLALADELAPGAPLASMAATAGYSDQAHLTREVQDLAGTTPARLLRERAPALAGATPAPLLQERAPAGVR